MDSKQDNPEEHESKPFVPSPDPQPSPIDKDTEPDGGSGSNEAEIVTPESAARRPRRPGRIAGRVALALVSVVALAASGHAYVTKDHLQRAHHGRTHQPGEPFPHR